MKWNVNLPAVPHMWGRVDCYSVIAALTNRLTRFPFPDGLLRPWQAQPYLASSRLMRGALAGDVRVVDGTWSYAARQGVLHDWDSATDPPAFFFIDAERLTLFHTLEGLRSVRAGRYAVVAHYRLNTTPSPSDADGS